jgi:hypothetical protein
MINKKSLFAVVFLSLFLFAMVSSSNLEVTKVDKGSVIISQLENPAVFEFLIKNYGSQDNFQIYSLVGIPMTPRGSFDLPSGTSNITVKIYPDKSVRKNDGFYIFEYQIKGVNSGIFKDTLSLKIVDLKDVLSLTSKNLLPGESSIVIKVKNLENTNLEDLKIRFISEFFDYTDSLSLEPFESKDITIPVNLEKAKKLNAGLYIINAELNYQNIKVPVSGTMNYLEKEGLSVRENSSGLIIKSYAIEKVNEGNVNANAKVLISKDIVSRLFSVYSVEPSEINRNGLYVDYIWNKELGPGERFSVAMTTNYTFPFVLVILIIFVAVLAKIYFKTNVTISKRVSFVKTHGEQSALKVTVRVRAKKTVENIQIIDRVPGGMHIYEKFGIKPDKVDPSTRRLIWNISKLNAGEERVYSYIIYSKLKIIGKLELPSATAIFESGDKSHEVFSNKTYFMNESLQRLE